MRRVDLERGLGEPGDRDLILVTRCWSGSWQHGAGSPRGRVPTPRQQRGPGDSPGILRWGRAGLGKCLKKGFSKLGPADRCGISPEAKSRVPRLPLTRVREECEEPPDVTTAPGR